MKQARAWHFVAVENPDAGSGSGSHSKAILDPLARWGGPMLFVIGWTDQQITNRSVRAIIGLLCRENHHKIFYNHPRVGLQSMFVFCVSCVWLITTFAACSIRISISMATHVILQIFLTCFNSRFPCPLTLQNTFKCNQVKRCETSTFRSCAIMSHPIFHYQSGGWRRLNFCAIVNFRHSSKSRQYCAMPRL